MTCISFLIVGVVIYLRKYVFHVKPSKGNSTNWFDDAGRSQSAWKVVCKTARKTLQDLCLRVYVIYTYEINSFVSQYDHKKRQKQH